jgi:hypothetical protein
MADPPKLDYATPPPVKSVGWRSALTILCWLFVGLLLLLLGLLALGLVLSELHDGFSLRILLPLVVALILFGMVIVSVKSAMQEFRAGRKVNREIDDSLIR